MRSHCSASSDVVDWISTFDFLAFDALVVEIRSVGVVPIDLNIGTQLMHPTLTHIAFYPILAVISSLEVNLMAVYTVAFIFVPLCTNGTQFI